MRYSLKEDPSQTVQKLALNEGNRRPEYKPGKGMKFTRYGGLKPTKQNNDSAPTSYGLWAFVYPYFDWWFVSGEMSKGSGRFKKEPKDQDQEKELKYTDLVNKSMLKHFWYSGPIYVRVKVPGSTVSENGRWNLTTTEELFDYLPKLFSKDAAEISKPYSPGSKPQDASTFDGKNDPGYMWSSRKNPYGTMTVDHYEVFIPGKHTKTY